MRNTTLSGSAVCLFVVACGSTSPGSAPASASDASAADAAMLGMASDAQPDRGVSPSGGSRAEGGPVAEDGSLVEAGDAGAGSGDSSVADAPGIVTGGAVCPTDPPAPAPIPSTGNVTFEITNTSAADRYVVTQAFGCDVFSIGGETLSLPFSCPCECSAPRPNFEVQIVPPGGSLTVTWDGRSLVVFAAHEDCTMFGAPGRCGAFETGALQPASAGTLSVTIDYLTSAPLALGAATCSPGGASGGYACEGTPSFQAERCAEAYLAGVSQTTATFDLPASGGVVVPVAIP